MSDPRLLALLAALVAAAQAYELIRALRTGRVRFRVGNVTRRGQPGRFRVYVIFAWVVLAMCAAAIVWALSYHSAS